MSRSAPNVNTTFPVVPGTSVVTPMYTSVGFNAGDYVYQYGANLVGWPKGATTGLGVENTAIAGATYTGYAQSGVNSRAASFGPLLDQITYSNPTVTAGQIIVSPTVLSTAAFATGAVKCTTLTDGRIAYAYKTGAGTLVSAIYTAAGVLQGSVTTISTNLTTTTTRNLSMCALSDGGFIVAFYNVAGNNLTFTRLNSSNAITSSGTTVISGSPINITVAATQNYYAFSYHVSDADGNAYAKTYSMSSNSLLGTFTTPAFSGIYNTCIAGTNSDTFMFAVGDGASSQTYFHHLNSSATQLGSYTAIAFSATNPMMAGCGATTSSNFTAAYTAIFAIPSSSNVRMVKVYAATGTTPTTTSVATSFPCANIALGSTSNGGCVLVYRNSTTDFRYATFDASMTQIATGVLVTGNILDSALGVSGVAGGTFSFAYGAPTTGFSTFGSAYTTTYTNGVTTITGATSYIPSSGYYVLGVALTTAAAGSTGLVATNGSVNLGSSYPVLTSNILFDYTGTTFTARSAINANRGNVIGTNVTLKGLE
jgi:hypothetical protein